MRISPVAPALVALASLISSANAHSWLEQLSNIASNSSYFGALGYPRGYISQARTDPALGNPIYNALPPWNDNLMVNLIPPNGLPSGNKITDDVTICMPSQQKSVQTNGFPVLNTWPGATISLQYQENGHTTQPNINAGKPANGGLVYIYGTADPRPDDKFNQIHKVWNSDGTGGDKRGKLLATRDFDDKQCHQLGDAPLAQARTKSFPVLEPTFPQDAGLWCQNNILLPSDLAVGKSYTLYWIWDFSTQPGYNLIDNPGKTVYTNQFYSTCSDVAVGKPQTQNSNVAMKAENLKIGAKPANFNKAGIASQLLGKAYYSSVPVIPSGAATSVPASPTPAPAASTPAPAPPAPPASAPASPTPAAAPPAASSAVAAQGASTPAAAPAAPVGASTSFMTVTVTPTTVIKVTQTGSPAAASAAPATKTAEVTIFETTTVVETPAANSGAVVPAPTDSATPSSAISSDFLSATVSGNFFQTAPATLASPAPSASMIPSGNCTKTAKKSVLFGSMVSGGSTKPSKRGFWHNAKDDAEKTGEKAKRFSFKSWAKATWDSVTHSGPSPKTSAAQLITKRGSLFGKIAGVAIADAGKLGTEVEDKFHLPRGLNRLERAKELRGD